LALPDIDGISMTSRTVYRTINYRLSLL